MNQREFERLLDTYGADIGRWPAAVQGEAEIFEEKSPEAHAARERMVAMDRLLLDCAPAVGEDCVEAAVAAVLHRQRMESAESTPRPRQSLFGFLGECLDWLDWQWAPRGAVVVGLVVLGCVANILARAETAEIPRDLWFTANLYLPLGG